MENIPRVDLPFKLFKRGKVRDVFEIGNRLLIVASDRISAFDFILPTLVTDKGRVLNRISVFFFQMTESLIPNHLIDDQPEIHETFKPFRHMLEKRSILAKKVKPFPLEAIVRGFLVGSGWQSYQNSGEVCGIRLPAGLKFADRLPEPLFAPSTKAEKGHDENISFDQLADQIGREEALVIQELSLELFRKVSAYAFERGIIVADSKFEFGRDDDGSVILIDEIFTPDSSRFWKREDWKPGKEPPAYDKQYVRNFLLSTTWDRKSPPPPLPHEVIAKTREKYLEIYQILTGQSL